nr:hypothetical protein [Tanacetum cinerariifolium]
RKPVLCGFRYFAQHVEVAAGDIDAQGYGARQHRPKLAQQVPQATAVQRQKRSPLPVAASTQVMQVAPIVRHVRRTG